MTKVHSEKVNEKTLAENIKNAENQAERDQAVIEAVYHLLKYDPSFEETTKIIETTEISKKPQA